MVISKISNVTLQIGISLAIYSIRHGLPIRRKMVTWGMDLYSFSWGLASEKLYKSVPGVTTFPLIGNQWQILCLPWHKTITYTEKSLNLHKPQQWRIRERPPHIIADGHDGMKTLIYQYLITLMLFVEQEWGLINGNRATTTGISHSNSLINLITKVCGGTRTIHQLKIKESHLL